MCATARTLRNPGATILEGIAGRFFDRQSPQKRDTIATNVIFSSNRRRLVTSLILVITTIILLILLIVNLDCIIFSEATVNTSTTTTLLASKHLQPPGFSNNTPHLASLGSKLTHSHQLVNVTNTSEAGQSVVDSHSTNTTTNLSSSSSSNSISSSTDPRSATGEKGAVNGGSSDSAVDIATTTDSLLAITTTAVINNDIASDSVETKRTNTSTSMSDPSPIQNGPCPLPTPDRNNATSNETSKYFDMEYAIKTFQDSMADKNAISLHHYLNGFKELMKFFHNLGTIFLFVTSDLETKIGLLEGYRNVEKGGCNPAYLTIQTAIDYETKENLLRDAKRQSGSRTILRLHRALEFLSAMMLNLSQLKENDETAPAVREAYSNTLARHHSWTVKTIASIAMRTIPNKKVLVESVLGKENLQSETITNERMLELANVTKNLFDVVDKIYEENDIKDLP